MPTVTESQVGVIRRNHAQLLQPQRLFRVLLLFRRSSLVLFSQTTEPERVVLVRIFIYVPVMVKTLKIEGDVRTPRHVPALKLVGDALVRDDDALDEGGREIAQALGLADGAIDAVQAREGVLGPATALVGQHAGGFLSKTVEGLPVGVRGQQVEDDAMTGENGGVYGSELYGEEPLGNVGGVELVDVAFAAGEADGPRDEIFWGYPRSDSWVARFFAFESVEAVADHGERVTGGIAPVSSVGECDEGTEQGMKDPGDHVQEEAVQDDGVDEGHHAAVEVLVSAGSRADQHAVGHLGDDAEPCVPELDGGEVGRVGAEGAVYRVDDFFLDAPDDDGKVARERPMDDVVIPVGARVLLAQQVVIAVEDIVVGGVGGDDVIGTLKKPRGLGAGEDDVVGPGDGGGDDESPVILCILALGSTIG